ncbi:head maturation protease, ClpP-related [Bacillus smithii]|uniref:head maturation protease, ClpP-related n=1 Tax=Bacillus smithii TaxID=1479 RepID=UPI002E1D34CC|nr:Clp protease ClpP [Bacillus smithii]MED1456650.1 Clp protease ClpP [Bacillus smithii]
MPQFLQVKNKTINSADLYIYGDIIDNTSWKWDDSDVMPDDVKNILDQLDDTHNLNIYINSGGGSVFAGIGIYNMLKRHQAQKTVYVDGVAASIASVIALAGDKVIVPSNAFLMIHKPWSFGIGNANDFRKMADDLDRIETGIMNIYKENLKEGVDLEQIQQMVDAETWLNGEQAAEYFNIEIGESVSAVACASEYFAKYRKTPHELMARNTKPPVKEKQNILMLQNELDLLDL